MPPSLVRSFVVLHLLILSCVDLHGASAFKLTFPTSSWVSCKVNVLQWSYDEGDPDIFSVALLNANRTMLNGNYQIANSLETHSGTALVQPNCVDAGEGYYVAFVNASRYAENEPQIYYSSPTFAIRPNSSDVPTPPGTRLSGDGKTLSGASTASLTNGSASNGSAASAAGGAPTYGAANPGTALKQADNGSSNGIVSIYPSSKDAFVLPTVLMTAVFALMASLVL